MHLVLYKDNKVFHVSEIGESVTYPATNVKFMEGDLEFIKNKLSGEGVDVSYIESKS